MGEADGMELIYSLVGYPDETEWLEFKEGNSDPVRTGRDISVSYTHLTLPTIA